MEGARTLLFDRLSQTSAPVSRTMDRRQLRNSILEEVARLLKTRSTPVAAILEAGRGTVLDYGIPDASGSAPSSEGDRLLLAETIARRIAAFEPRLRDVRVNITHSPESARAVSAVLTGNLQIGPVSEPVSFPLNVDRDTQRLGMGEMEPSE